MNNIEHYTQDYWKVSIALRLPVAPRLRAWEQEGISLYEAFNLLNDALDNANPDRPVARLAHELKMDLVEGDTKWRETKRKNGTNSTLIPFTRK